MPPSPLVMFLILIFNDVVHCITSRPIRLFAGYESQLTPLGPSNRPQPLALDEHLPIEGWIKPNGEAQKGNFLNIQASSSKRST